MDLRWYDDLDPFGAETTSAEEELRQDLLHILLQERGQVPGANLDDPTRGLSVGNILSDQIPAGFLHEVETELAQDERVAAVSASIEVNDIDPRNPIAVLSVNVEPKDDLMQAFNIQVPLGVGTSKQA